MTKQNTNQLLSDLGLVPTEAVQKKKRAVSQDVPDAIENGLSLDFGRRAPAFYFSVNVNNEENSQVMRVHLGSTEQPLESFQNASAFLKMLAATCLEGAQIADDAIAGLENPQILEEYAESTMAEVADTLANEEIAEA